MNDPHAIIPVPANELQRLRESNATLIEALKPFAHFADQWDKNPLRGIATDRTYVIHSGDNEGIFSVEQCYAARAAIAAARPVEWHDDKPDGRPDMHISTQPGDLTSYGSPLKPGR